jgi:Gpi18-like mannosyltransferase
VKKIPWKKLLLTVFLWRVFLFIISFYADSFLIYDPSFPYYRSILARLGFPRWIFSWGNFDGVHYLTIVKKGYLGTGLIQAFFPVFPMILRFFRSLSIDLFFPITLGFQFLVTWVLSGTLFYFVKETLGKSKKIAWWSAISLLIFPASFFMGALYGEGLFLLFILLSFIFAKKKRWLLAGIFGAMASATRVVGIAILPALLIELWLSRKNKLSYSGVVNFIKKDWLNIIKISLSSLGLLAYMFYLQKTFNDPLYFFYVQSEFGAGREEGLILLPQVIWRYLKIFMTAPVDLKMFAYVQEFLFSIGAFCLLIFSWKKVRLSYLLFSLLVLLIPTFTGTFSSMPRYIMVAFPIYFLLGEWFSKKSSFKVFALVLSLLLLIINTLLFIQGYWVA